MNKSQFQVVRYKPSRDTSYEVMTKPGNALKYREGSIGFSDVLFSDDVFTDISKGDKPTDADLKKAFGTSNTQECAKTIVDKGELALSTAERKERVDRMKLEIINYIHKYYIDPKTKMPHPAKRIELALDQMKVTFDPFVPAEKQFHDKIEKRLPELIPVKRCEMMATITIPHSVIAACQGVLKKRCKIGKEDWNATGCTMEISFVPGDYDALISELNTVTKGDFVLDVVGQQQGSSTPDTGKGRGKGARGRGKAK
eukprot:TRINITY_DN14168_c0_g1_i1.p1 TRINITY_DN14168_c0_g1~~TRINITY_DN14168_c0_g1_i1.p1  ORF type:complete len:256 (+),score=60.46 TRINITY_DN14168_c0_g1_i1:41-808(+)